MSSPEVSSLVFSLFGARGDLSHRLVVPALYHLHRRSQLPHRFLLLAIDRAPGDATELADSYRRAMADAGESVTDTDFSAFASTLDHFQADLDDKDFAHRLAGRISDWEKKSGATCERLFYLALPPFLFAKVANALADAGLNRRGERLVVEKPLGRDLASYLELERALSRHYTESQLFRMDHFLGKEAAQNILALRFANPIFEPIWNRNHVDHVTITVAETLGVEHRAGFYEGTGALRDMMQNHLTQLLCLMAMEPPARYAAEDLRDRRMDVMHALRPIASDQVQRVAVRGQYGEGWLGGQKMPAYRAEPGVAPGSVTETYAALRLFVDNWRWQDVPFYLRTGKRMAADVWEISVRFRPVPHHAFPAAPGESARPVSLILRMQPEHSVRLRIFVKEPGSHAGLRPVSLDFNYAQAFGDEGPTAYETLIKDVIAGDPSLFVRGDQAEAAWRFIEPVLTVWERETPADFPNYAAGSWGPAAAEILPAELGHAWLVPDLRAREHE